MKYRLQTFNSGQVLSVLQLAQIETNIKAHYHGASGISGAYLSVIGNVILDSSTLVGTKVATSVNIQTAVDTDRIYSLSLRTDDSSSWPNNIRVGSTAAVQAYPSSTITRIGSGGGNDKLVLVNAAPNSTHTAVYKIYEFNI